MQKKVLMPIRITSSAKWNNQQEGVEPGRLNASLAEHLKASYHLI